VQLGTFEMLKGVVESKCEMQMTKPRIKCKTGKWENVGKKKQEEWALRME